MRVKRVGVLGGTFDPAHLGHIHLAWHAMREVLLDEILFIPAAQPPHKKSVTTSFQHRLAMLQFACESTPEFSVSTLEDELPKPSYTIDTLEVLPERYGIKARFFFIIGLDAFLEIKSWKQYQKVLLKADFILSKRSGADDEELELFLNTLGYSKKGDEWVGSAENKIIFLRNMPPEVSSSSIREEVNRLGKCTGLDEKWLTPKVAAYIEKHQLYI